MRVTNLVFAEDEDGLEGVWPTFSQDRGFPKRTSCVTAVPASDFQLIFHLNWLTPESREMALTGMGRTMNFTKRFYMSCLTRGKGGGPYRDGINLGAMAGMLFISRGVARGFHENGYSKADFKKAVWDRAKFPWAWAQADFPKDQRERLEKVFPDIYAEGKDWPMCPSPDQYFLVVAGGSQSGHCSYVRFGGNSQLMAVSKPVKLPPKAQWDSLLKQAERDLGPIPVRV
jgi:hypothetical protein